MTNRGNEPAYPLTIPPQGNFEGVLPEFIHMEIKKGSQSVFKRNFTDVLKSNRLGFNTTNLANGSYDVFFKVSARGTFSKEQSLKILIRNL